MSVNSKKKGGRFELKVSKWFTEFSGYKFQRVPIQELIMLTET